MSDQDKINIYVPREVGELLDSDNEMFELFKSDGATLNRNLFLTQLVAGYYDVYARELQAKYEAILAELSLAQIDRKMCEQIASSILDQLSPPRMTKRVGRKAMHFSLKPTNKTESMIRKIRREIEKKDYVSRYLANMLASYCEKPFSQRERIIFKDSYDMLTACCTEVCVRLTPKGRGMYNKLYFGRPAYLREENKSDGCYQYYHCSHNQLELYFRRFGAEAEVISPESLRDKMGKFYRLASRAYNG